MRPRVVVCGSYHRDPAGLQRLFRELEMTGCRIISPIGIDFSDLQSSVVRTENEKDFTTLELERFHLRAVNDADLIWLHAPDGYIGLSAAFEIGYAIAKNIPIYCFQKPHDEMLATLVHKVDSVFLALENSP